MNNYHQSVMLNEAIELLNVKPGEQYIDATLGGGGHTAAILELGARVLSIDMDTDAIANAKERFGDNQNLTIVHDNFANIGEITKTKNIEDVSGILYDLGVSSHQLDTPERGFSFQSDAPLDMRMDQSLSVTAADLVAALGPKELTLLFTKFGDESQAKKYAQAIVTARKFAPIPSTRRLAAIIEHAARGYQGKIHPATKVFQALRIAVNDELGSIEKSLKDAFEILKPGGRLVIISFHSGEDRIVKHFFKTLEDEQKVQIITNKPLEPSSTEVVNNFRARSAKLRALQKND